MSLPYY